MVAAAPARCSPATCSNPFLLEGRPSPQLVGDDRLLDLVGSPKLLNWVVPIPAPRSEGLSSREFMDSGNGVSPVQEV